MGFSTRGFSDDEDIDLHLHPHWSVFVRPTFIIPVGLIFVWKSNRINVAEDGRRPCSSLCC